MSIVVARVAFCYSRACMWAATMTLHAAMMSSSTMTMTSKNSSDWSTSVRSRQMGSRFVTPFYAIMTCCTCLFLHIYRSFCNPPCNRFAANVPHVTCSHSQFPQLIINVNKNAQPSLHSFLSLLQFLHRLVESCNVSLLPFFSVFAQSCLFHSASLLPKQNLCRAPWDEKVQSPFCRLRLDSSRLPHQSPLSFLYRGSCFGPVSIPAMLLRLIFPQSAYLTPARLVSFLVPSFA